jgi:hypothetical protein
MHRIQSRLKKTRPSRPRVGYEAEGCAAKSGEDLVALRGRIKAGARILQTFPSFREKPF